jgi:hypothetical protein
MTDDVTPTRVLGRDRLLAILREQGIGDAEAAVDSELDEDIPQVARLLTVAMLWRRAVDPWRTDPTQLTAWTDGAPTWDVFRDAADALGRAEATGCTREDLALIAYRVAAETLAQTLYWLTGEGRDPTAPDDAPGVALVELDAEDRPTGRIVDMLHEDWALGLDLGGDESP